MNKLLRRSCVFLFSIWSFSGFTLQAEEIGWTEYGKKVVGTIIEYKKEGKASVIDLCDALEVLAKMQANSFENLSIGIEQLENLEKEVHEKKDNLCNKKFFSLKAEDIFRDLMDAVNNCEYERAKQLTYELEAFKIMAFYDIGSTAVKYTILAADFHIGSYKIIHEGKVRTPTEVHLGNAAERIQQFQKLDKAAKDQLVSIQIGIATAGFRNAGELGRRIVEEVKNTTSIDIEIIDQASEAMLAYMATKSKTQDFNPQNGLVWDIGGQSQQIISQDKFWGNTLGVRRFLFYFLFRLRQILPYLKNEIYEGQTVNPMQHVDVEIGKKIAKEIITYSSNLTYSENCEKIWEENLKSLLERKSSYKRLKHHTCNDFWKQIPIPKDGTTECLEKWKKLINEEIAPKEAFNNKKCIQFWKTVQLDRYRFSAKSLLSFFKTLNLNGFSETAIQELQDKVKANNYRIYGVGAAHNLVISYTLEYLFKINKGYYTKKDLELVIEMLLGKSDYEIYIEADTKQYINAQELLPCFILIHTMMEILDIQEVQVIKVNNTDGLFARELEKYVDLIKSLENTQETSIEKNNEASENSFVEKVNFSPCEQCDPVKLFDFSKITTA